MIENSHHKTDNSGAAAVKGEKMSRNEFFSTFALRFNCKHETQQTKRMCTSCNSNHAIFVMNRSWVYDTLSIVNFLAVLRWYKSVIFGIKKNQEKMHWIERNAAAADDISRWIWFASLLDSMKKIWKQFVFVFHRKLQQQNCDRNVKWSSSYCSIRIMIRIKPKTIYGLENIRRDRIEKWVNLASHLPVTSIIVLNTRRRTTGTIRLNLKLSL